MQTVRTLSANEIELGNVASGLATARKAKRIVRAANKQFKAEHGKSNPVLEAHENWLVRYCRALKKSQDHMVKLGVDSYGEVLNR